MYYEAAPEGLKTRLGKGMRPLIFAAPDKWCRWRSRLNAMRAAREFIAKTIRALRLVVADGRIPRPLRWLAALGLLPIPGPFDEAVLLLVAPPILVFYREPLRDAWRRA